MNGSRGNCLCFAHGICENKSHGLGVSGDDKRKIVEKK